MGDENELTLLR